MHEAVRAYRVIQMQCQSFNMIYGLIVAAAKCILIVFSVTCAFAVIRLDGLIAVSMGAAGGFNTILFLVLLKFYAGINVDSSDYLVYLKTLAAICRKPKDRKILKKSLLGMQALEVNIMSLYFVDKLSPLVAIRIISENIIFLLVQY